MNPEDAGTPEHPRPASLGHRVWLVLGGGGPKGLAHVGVWRALTEKGIQIQGVVGTSIGALIAALASAGVTWERMDELARELRRRDIVRVNRRAVLINGLRQASVFRGEALREYFEELLPEAGWDALRIPIQINAVDLEQGRTEWFGPGARTDVSLVDAVYASAALPVFYPPAIVGGGVYVDGGAEHPLALQRAAEMGATGIVGVDVGSGEKGRTDEILEQGMLAVHQRVFSIMTWRRRRDLIAQWEGPPLLFIRPKLEGFHTFDFDSVDYFLRSGYEAAGEALDGWGVG